MLTKTHLNAISRQTESQILDYYQDIKHATHCNIKYILNLNKNVNKKIILLVINYKTFIIYI